MSTIKNYLTYVGELLEKVSKSEEAHIETAADYVASSCEQGGRFYVFGSGHSHMIAEELYIRAGGLALVKAILPPELMLHEMANKSTLLERLDGYADAMLDLYKLDDKDTIMIISNSGRNNVPVEMALGAKARGAKVIAMTSMEHSSKVTSRHKSSKKLYEVADVTIDNGGQEGDATYYLDNFDVPIGPTSDTIGIALANALIVRVVEKLVEVGFDVPVFKSSNIDGGDAYNDELFNKYYGYWK